MTMHIALLKIEHD